MPLPPGSVDLLNPPRLDKSAVRKSFNRCADDYDRLAALQAEVLSRLLERLDWVRLQPERVLDLGCGTGLAIPPLRKRYRGARIVALDLAERMLAKARSRYGLLERKWLINADFEALPIRDDCIDLLFSSLALQWSNDLPAALREFRRVGRDGGLLQFTTFGVDTLKELRAAWSRIDDRPHVHRFLDLHDIGDMMLTAGLREPVVDVETITLEYHCFTDLLRDLKGIGASNADVGRGRGLLTPGCLRRLEAAYRETGFADGVYRASYEVVYGHAWF
jgi:malonyl-CoA O-methyltransferase